MITVSVVIPTYNSGPLVSDAVESVLAQTRPPDEIIVVDDGSTDDTRSRLSSFQGRIKYVGQPNQGRSTARNTGIRQTTGDFVAFLDADDTWYPAKLETQIADLSRHPGVKWAYGQTLLVNEQGVPLQSDFWPDIFGKGQAGAHSILDGLLGGNIEISTSTVVIERSSLLGTGLFDESLPSGEDTNLWIRLAQEVGPTLFTPNVLATRRVSTRTSFLERIIEYGYVDTSPRAFLDGLAHAPNTNGAISFAGMAVSRTYLDSAFIEISQGRLSEAMQYLQKANEWSSQEQINEMIALRLADFSQSGARYHRDGPLEAERILQRLLPELLKAGWVDKNTEKLAWSQLFAAIAYMYERKRQTEKMVTYARRALRSNPRLIGNIGLCKRAMGR